jgi:hypothetical protein
LFNLSRYFSTLSFILIVLAAGLLGPLYRHISIQQMTTLAEDRNVAMARVFENSSGQVLIALLGNSAGRDAESLRAAVSTQELRAKTVALMQGTAVIKIKVYNRLGIVVFSTDTSQIGESKLGNEGFKGAIGGVVTSNLTHRDSIDAFEGTRAEVDVLSSYIPITGEGKTVEGVFELYQDVSPFMASLNRALWWVTAGLISVLAGLYLIHSVAELCISPVGLSMITKLSIARIVGMMMGVWFLSISVAQYFAGMVAQVASVETVGGQVTNLKVSLDTYIGVFTTIGEVSIGIGVLLLLFSFPLKYLMHGVK